MSENQWWEDDDDDAGDEPPAPPAQNPRDLRVQLKAALKAKKELEGKLASAEGQVRKANIGSYFREKGIDPRLAKYVPADLEPTKEALEAWVAEDGELFNIKPVSPDGNENKPPESQEGTPGTPGLTGDNITPEVQAGWNAINGTTANALPPGKSEDLMAAITGANDYEALKKVIFSNGGGGFASGF